MSQKGIHLTATLQIDSNDSIEDLIGKFKRAMRSVGLVVSDVTPKDDETYLVLSITNTL